MQTRLVIMRFAVLLCCLEIGLSDRVVRVVVLSFGCLRGALWVESGGALDLVGSKASVIQSCTLVCAGVLGVQASPTARKPITNARIKASGLRCQTLWYRAPEVCLGDRGFGPVIDVWSLGLVLAEMAGEVFFQVAFTGQDKAADRHAYLAAIFGRLGQPTCQALVSLPLWPKPVPRGKRQAWPAGVLQKCGPRGVELLDAMLTFNPALRATTGTVLGHACLHPSRFFLVAEGEAEGASSPSTPGTPSTPGRRSSTSPGASHTGVRHDWNLRAGNLAPEVLEWLRADVALTPGTPEHRALGLDGFDVATGNVKSEEGRKFILAGAMGECSTTAMCGLSLRTPFPIQRVASWLRAFRRCNLEALARLQSAAKRVCYRFNSETRGQNGQAFLDTPFEQWFCTCAELVISRPSLPDGSYWVEPRHRDGGASVLHMGMTLFGRRTLRCEQAASVPEWSSPAGAASAPDVVLENVPGTVYLGGLTGPWHQVSHQRAEPAELWVDPVVGPVAVAVMFRTALFPWDRSRLRNTTPSPVAFFRALSESFRGSLAAEGFSLPSFAECLAAHEVSHPSEIPPSSPV